MTNRNPQLALGFDTTGSMGAVFHEVKTRMLDLVKALKSRQSDLEIAIIAHGDYCDGSRALSTLDFTRDTDVILSFVKGIRATSGGDYPEFYDFVFKHAALNLSWNSGDQKAYVMIADALNHRQPHVEYRRFNFHRFTNLEVSQGIDYELNRLVSSGVRMYAVQCEGHRYNRREEKELFSKIGNINNGAHIELRQFDLLADLLEAIGANNAGLLDEYTSNLNPRLQLNVGFQRAVAQLSGRSDGVDLAIREAAKTRASFGDTYGVGDVGELIPVKEGTFQVSRIDEDFVIKTFVNDVLGGCYKAGDGYYQLTKTETVQANKQIVLRSKNTGEYFTGEYARKMIGLPIGVSSRLNPRNVSTIRRDYDVFIQSNSYNRKLKKGQEFLYKVSYS